MWYQNVGTSLFCSVTIHAFDRQTDGQRDRQTFPPMELRSMLILANLILRSLLLLITNCCALLKTVQ